MTICAACRVRHLKCDSQSPCTDCKKNGRDCLRVNVRFRNLVCPSKRTTRADHNKYEFFFEEEQPWIDTQGHLKFVAEGDGDAENSPIAEPENYVFDAPIQNTELQLASLKQSSPKSIPVSMTEDSALQASVMDNDPSTIAKVLECRFINPPEDALLSSIAGTPIRSPKESSQSSDQPPESTVIASLEKILPASQPRWPVKSLQEGKLFQHFITHLAPWVRTDFLELST